MKIGHKAKGKRGEEQAVEYLKGLGFEIIELNYRCRLGEIDIIAKDEDTLVFLEVKTRSTAGFGEPEAAVNLAKQKRISRVSLHYLQSHHNPEQKARFDVVAVDCTKDPPQIRLIKDAFDLFWE